MVGMLSFIAQAESSSGNPFSSLLGGNGMLLVMMVVFMGFFYFTVIRPQNKKKKEMQNMLNALKKGDKIVTIGGVHGKVVTVKDDTVTIRVDDRAEITFDKSAISQVVAKPGNQEKDKAEDSEKKENTK